VRAPGQYLVLDLGLNLNQGCSGNGIPTPIFVALHFWLLGKNDSLLFHSKLFRCEYDHYSTVAFGNHE